MKTKKIIISGLICMFILTGCSDEELKTKDISKVRNNLESDYKEIKSGKYQKFTCEDFEINFTDNNEIYNIHTDCYSNTDANVSGSEIIERMDEFKQSAKTIIGEEYSDANLSCVLNEIETNVTYEELTNNINDGLYNDKNLAWLVYSEKLGNNSISFSTTPAYSLVWLKKGLLTKYGYKQLYDYCVPSAEAYKVYYKHSCENDLEDEYLMPNGKTLKVSDAIKYIENYFNNELVFRSDSNIEKEVSKVYVIKIGEETYCYYCTLRGVFNGIVFDDTIGGGMTSKESELKVNYDISYVTIVGNEEIDSYCYAIDNKNIKNIGDKIEEIIALKDAIKILSGALQDNSYIISSIELSYRMKYIDDLNKESEGYPVWKVELYDTDNKQQLKYYVNAVTGEVEQCYQGI